MNKINWIQQNKLVVLIIFLVLGVYAWNQVPRLLEPLSPRNTGMDADSSLGIIQPIADANRKIRLESTSISPEEIAPSTSTSRIRAYSASITMVAENVRQSLEAIEQVANNAGGFLIQSHISSPIEEAYGSISIRVPSDKLSTTIEEIKKLGNRVTTESVSSTDLTDEYEDIGAKLNSLKSTMIKFESIQSQAKTVEESMSVQEQILNLQDRIDHLVGRQEYLEKSSQLSLITVTLASDEFSLPYAPENTWRPQVVFKLAIRSLIQTGRSIVNFVIWIGVYSIIWLPLGAGALLLKRRLHK